MYPKKQKNQQKKINHVYRINKMSLEVESKTQMMLFQNVNSAIFS